MKDLRIGELVSIDAYVFPVLNILQTQYDLIFSLVKRLSFGEYKSNKTIQDSSGLDIFTGGVYFEGSYTLGESDC